MKPGLMKTPAQAAILIPPTPSQEFGLGVDASLQAPTATEIHPTTTVISATSDYGASSPASVSEAPHKRQSSQNLQVSRETSSTTTNLTTAQLPPSSPLASTIPTQTSMLTEHPTNSSILSSDTPLSTLPSDVVFQILERIPALALDCSNAFSIPENNTFVDPTLSTANLKKMSAAQTKKKRIIPVPISVQAITPPASSTALVLTTPPASSTANPAPKLRFEVGSSLIHVEKYP
ncbi:hypothetical protein MRB53_005410 [Persea americana]|uniref:Uncharacterized protein n=1 Tax=Persea americana TaxID=3435 RepID=A0ACC2MCZ6_PERAE|nr:hypothetical protein MRB53_005410 [Persea americana]